MRKAAVVGLVAGLLLWTAGVFLVLRLGRGLLDRKGPRGVEAPEPDDSGRSGPEALAVERATPPGTRPARDDDAEASPERQDLVEAYREYHPYFVRGDLDGDGALDFVQAFVRERGGQPLFDVAVFLGDGTGGFRPPLLVETGLDLAAGDLTIDRTLLVVTPDLTAEQTRRFRFDRVRRRFVDVDAEGAAPEDDAPDATPDDRPRAHV